ncbi:hypothetical protein [Streptomyces sp. NPDC047706]|uniref:hypothetical protein n=1 Tax=Streptomyces sp. NPDC047706 TaxID=3365486 RepID=UPI00371A3F54
MKSLKAAAVVAGSLVAASAAVPAFAAHNPADLTPTSLNGAVNTITKGPIDVMPLKHQSDALNTENKDSVLSSVKDTTTTLNKNGLLGGLPPRR